jgi:hypothetical protein
MASGENKRKHPNLASWLSTFTSPAPGETHGHGGEELLQQAGAADVDDEAPAAAAAAAAGVPKPTLRQATKDTSTWLEHHRTPAEESGEAARDPRIPVFKLGQGARRHAAFVCAGRRQGGGCTTPATDKPSRCTDEACSQNGAPTVPVPAFYRCPGSCRGAVLAPSLCYPIAASICEREDEPIFAVVGCGSCERQIRADSSGSLVLCGKVCTACIPVYVAAKLPGTEDRAVVLTETCRGCDDEGSAGDDAAQAAAVVDEQQDREGVTGGGAADSAAADAETQEPAAKRPAR